MPDAYKPTGQRWWQIEGADLLAAEVWSIAHALKEDQKARQEQLLEYLSIYEGKHLEGLTAAAYQTKADYLNLTLPVCRSLCESVQADIAGRQRPKPQFMTSGADWQTRRRARKLDKFVMGQLSQPQGRYVDSWELMTDAFLDAAIWGMGVVKVFPDLAANRVCHERVFPFELFADPQEARYGNPVNLFHVYTMDREAAKLAFVVNGEGTEQEKQEREAALDRALAVDDDGYGRHRRVAHQIEMVEAWRLPLAPDIPGRHVFVINGSVLHDEPWEAETFGFVFIRWAPNRMGFDGAGLVEESQAIQEELDQWAMRTQESMRIRSGRRTYYQVGSIDENHLEANDSETLIPVEAGAQMPTVEALPPLSGMELDYGQFILEQAYHMSGVSQLSATSRKEPGIESGVALRTMADLSTKRFSVKARVFENSFVALGKEDVRCAATIPGYKVRLPGQGAYEEVAWTEASLEQDRYEIRVAPASSLPDDPAGRLAMVQEMYSSGVIGVDTFRRLLDWSDLDKELSRDSAEFEYIEHLIDRYLDATPEEAKAPAFFEMPEGFLYGKEPAMVQVGAAYFEARRQGAPEENLELLRRYITELERALQKAQAAQAQIAQGQAPQVAGAPAGVAPPSPAPSAAPAGAPALPQPPARAA